MSNPNSPERPAPFPRWLRWLLVPALAGWVWFQVAHTSVVAAGSDASGYLNFARLLAEGRLSLEQRIPPELAGAHVPGHFLPLGFWMAPDPEGWLVPTYPPGLPLHLAAAGLVFGWETGPLLVVVGASVAALLLFLGCARAFGVPPPLAAAGAALLALSPQFQFSSFQPMSDVPATAWCLAAVWLARRARDADPGTAAAAGAALAVAVLVRPTNVLLLPALAILLADWRRLLAAAAGGLPGALFLLWLNHRLYGHPLKSGYGNVLGTLDTQWFIPTVAHIVRHLAVLLPAAVLVLPFAALAGWRERRRDLLALAAWAAAIAGFYACYAVTHEVWWYLRFLLPAFPALLIAALLGADRLCAFAPVRWNRAARPAVAVALIGWAAGNLVGSQERLEASLLHRYDEEYRVAARWAADHLPAEALVVTLNSSGALYRYTGFAVLRWDSLTVDQYRAYAAALRRAGRPVYAMLFPDEVERGALRDRVPDHWEKAGEAARVGFWKLWPDSAP